MASERRPAPSASGTLATTPLANALVYARNRRLFGRLELRAHDGHTSEITFLRGQIVAVSSTPSPCYLGALLYELGLIDTATLDATLREVAEAKRLHGELLVERGAITARQRDDALVEQMCRKVHAAFVYAPDSAFAFYADDSSDPARGPALDPLVPFWRGVRETPPRASIDAVLAKFSRAPLRLVDETPLERIGLAPEEKALVAALDERSLTLAEIREFASLTPARAELVAYLLLVAKCVEPAPARGSSRPRIPAAPVSRPRMPAAPTSSPRIPVAPTSSPRVPVAPVSQPRISASTTSGEMRRPSFSFRVPSSPKVPAVGAPSSPPAPAQELVTPDALGAEGVTARARTIDRESYFEVLGLPDGASVEAVRAAYFRLAKLWHPDKLPAALAPARAEAETIFSYMSRAHRTLTDATARRGYLASRPAPAAQRRRADVIRTIELALAREDFGVAESESLALSESDPDDAEAHALVSWATSWAGAAPEDVLRASLSALDRAVSTDHQCDRAYYYRGMIHKRLGNAEGAYRDFTRAAQLNPRHVEAQREVRLHEMRAKKGWF